MTYHAREHREGGDGSIAIEGTSRSVRWMALAMLAAFLLLRRVPMVTVALLLFGAYILVFPPKRRVVFDASERALRVDHAGAFHERGRRVIPFADITRVDLVTRGGATDLLLRTKQGDHHLLVLDDPAAAQQMGEKIARLL